MASKVNDERPCVLGQGLRIFFCYISVNMMGFAKDVLLLSMSFEVGSYWIGCSEKDICSQVEYVHIV